MSKNHNSNKISGREQQQAARIKSKLQRQGVGKNEAAKRAPQEAAKEMHSGRGGGKNAGGEPQKGAEKRRPGGRLRSRP